MNSPLPSPGPDEVQLELLAPWYTQNRGPSVVVNLLSFCATCRTLTGRMDRTTPDPKQKRERFRKLAQTGKVKIGNVFAADLRKSKVPSIVRKFSTFETGSVNYCFLCDKSHTWAERMDRTTPDPKQKRERFRELAQTGKVKIGKVFAADLRKSKVPPIVHKLTAWRKANRLSQRKAVAVLGDFYFPITFASLRSWEEGRRSPNPHTARILEKFLTDHPIVESKKRK